MANEPVIRRNRTTFTDEQLTLLELEYLNENYVTKHRRCELACLLGLPESTIKVWFQNRRVKDKRQNAVRWPFEAIYSDPNLAASILQAAANSVGMYAPNSLMTPIQPPCTSMESSYTNDHRFSIPNHHNMQLQPHSSHSTSYLTNFHRTDASQMYKP